jgi:hypothetical protein
MKRVEHDYVVAIDLVEAPASGLEGTVGLISNNLANRQALTLSASTSAANAVLSGKAHQIDGHLHQYWVTITPQGEHDVAALSASAYIVLPKTAMPAPAVELPTVQPVITAVSQSPTLPPVSIPNAGKDGFISALSISAPASLTECGNGSCSLLRTTAQTDSIVFFLEHQANHGLVRLADADCRNRTVARIVRNGQDLRFPIARTTTRARDHSETLEWKPAPENDTYYAVVARDARVARQLANHIDQLPMRCTDSLRAGIEDEELREWLEELAMLTARNAQHIDWRAIEVRNVL